MKNYPPVDQIIDDFSQFLNQNGYSKPIRWITSRDLIYIGRKVYILPYDHKETENAFKKAYSEAEKGHLGIKLSCCTSDDKYSYCSFYIPEDQYDADRLLMNDSPKFACPADKSIKEAKRVSNKLMIAYLKFRERKYLKWKSGLIEDRLLIDQQELNQPPMCKTMTEPTTHKPEEWDYKRLLAVLLVAFVLQCLFLPCLCNIGTANMTLAIIVDGFIIIRLIVAKLIQEKGKGWIFYAILAITFPIWILLLSHLITGH